MDINALIEGFGFPIACVLALGWYINKKDAEAKEDRQRERENDRIEKERLYEELSSSRQANQKVLQTNQEVSETNKILVRDFTENMDSLKTKVSTIGVNVEKILEKVGV